MQKPNQIAVLVVIAGCAAGCASTAEYFTDRGRDLADIVTIGVGMGLGAKARLGPVQTGLLADVQMIALRGGQFCRLNGEGWVFEIDSLFEGADLFCVEDGSLAEQRRKDYIAERSDIPLVMIAPGCPSYYTQIEVAAGLVPSLRLGVNPGEFVDFILGWANVDLFGDDIEGKGHRATEGTSCVEAAPPAEK